MTIIDPFELPSLPLSWKKALPKCPAIYFALSLDSKILYIGSTVNLHSRWISHARFKDLKAFSNVRISWFQMSDISSLAALEGQAIRDYKPLLNMRRTKGDGTGYVYKRTVSKAHKEYNEFYYHYEEWSKGDRLLKKTKYIPKRLVAKIQELEQEKVPVVEILRILGVLVE